ncbi:amino acid adenylation domain-containing protein [Actinomadura sp. 9N215]|uniref:amino acid adenylation domain-containing protein n=1 Tax=Actinomadura sp. 9N215 TaxID=3375150 RepID=UPI003795336E
MTAIELLSHLRDLGVRIRLDGDRLRLYAPDDVLTPALREQLSDHREEILRFLRSAGTNGAPASSPITVVSREQPVMLSFAQQRLWFLAQFDPDSSEYNISTALQLSGPIDVDALHRALDEVVARHEVLRTTIATTPDGVPTQNIRPPAPIPLPLTDLSGHEAEPERTREARRLIDAQAGTAFDLANDPPLRAQLIRLADNEHVLGLTLHHIASDERSAGILRGELSTLYEAYRNGLASPLEPLAVQYADYAAWQRARLTDGVAQEHLGYWRTRLAGLRPLDLPTDRPRPALRDPAGAMHRSIVPAETTRRLRELGRRSNASMFITLLATFQALLARSTGQQDISVGTPVAVRTHPDTEPLIGLFVNTLVLRTDTSGGPTFGELLARVRRISLDAYAHQDLPFEHLVDKLQPRRDPARHPLFDVLFSYQNGGDALDRAGFGDLSACGFPVAHATTQFDLNLTVTERHGELHAALEYSTHLFEAASVERLMTRWGTILDTVADHPHVRLSEIELTTASERRQLRAWSTGPISTVPHRPAHHLIAERAAATPDDVAVVTTDRQLPYGELDRQANRLAHQLRTLGAGPETIVGVLLPSSPDLLIALLATWRAGAAYLPLDPRAPLARIAFQLADADVGLVVTTTDQLDQLPEHRAPLLLLDDPVNRDAIAANPGTPPPDDAVADNCAYLIYTSGSTGAPKAVAVPHRALTNYLHWAREAYWTAEPGRCPVTAPTAVDLCLTSLLVPLINGRPVVVGAEPSLTVPDRYGLVKLTPSHLTALTAASPDASRTHWPELLVIGGEQLKGDVLESWYRDGAPGRVVNEYGPTEATIGCCTHEVAADERPTRVPIGMPVVNTTLHVLDDRLRPVPTGVPGELLIGGSQLARGYYQRSALTAERFVADPFAADGSRLYRTGDLVRRRGDGQLEFLGRTDDQVKVRGHRIEPGEIEFTLAEHPHVRTATVVARDDEPYGTRLTAYLVPAGEPPDAGALRAFLRGRLPEPMIPAAFVVLDELPLTSGGKLDRRALPAPGATRPELPTAFTEPTTPTEHVLADVWRRVLKIDRVGADDDFFDLGGHSLLAAQVIARVRVRFHVDVPIAALFNAPTLRSFAAAVDDSGRVEPPPPLDTVDRGRPLEPSFAQQRLWFLQQLQPDSSEYNVPLALRLTGRLDVAALRGALNAIAARHEVLRTTITTGPDGAPVQSIAPAAPVPLGQIDLAALPLQQARDEARQLIGADAAVPFDLAADPPWRAQLIRAAAHEHILCAVFHHIAFDDWSARIFIQELSTLYDAFREGAPSSLKPLPCQYADYSAWQKSWLSGRTLERQVDYWRGQLANLPILDLPSDRPRPRERDSGGALHRFTVPSEVTNDLRELSRQSGTSMFMVVLTGFQALLARYSGQDDIAIGTMIAGRAHPETERLIGFFVNTLVLRADATGDPPLTELLARTRETTLDAYTHQDLPFEHLVEVLQPVRDRGRNPLFDVMFTYDQPDRADQADQIADLGHLDICGFAQGHTTTKFDLSLSVGETGGVLQGGVEYSTALFDAATIERMVGHLTALLAAIATEPGQHLSEVALMSRGELAQVVRVSSGPATPAVPDILVHELVDRHARTTPEKAAVVAGEDVLTYLSLEQSASKLAHLLRERGVGPESVVALCLGRTPQVLTAVLGVLKAGGIYLPLDAEVPGERLSFLLTDSRAVLTITTTDLRDRVPRRADGSTLVLDDPMTVAALRRCPPTPPTVALSPDCGAYLIYTSGSTGQPKGTIGTHRNLVYLHHAWTHTHGLPTNDTLLTTANLTFDAFTGDWTRALTTGATLHIGPDRRHLDPTHLAHLLTHHHITALETTPHQLTALHPHINPHHPPPLTTLIITADTWHAHDHHTTHTLLPHTQLLTSYGLTETTVDTTTCNTTHHQPHPQQTLPIGHPLPHTTVHLLDNHLQPVPPGIPGQIYITGTGLTRGYHNHPALTAERFIANPHTTNGTRLYRTGDQARRNPDGTLHFLGRTDHQINLHGHRIEPTEIETALTTHPHIHTAATTLHHTNNHTQLTAYIVPDDSERPPNTSELRSHLKARLPDHMVPAVFVPLDALPLTTTGKLDRNALPAPGTDRPALADGYQPPRTPTEHAVADIWRDVLGLDRVGVHDDFFDLGGHSILAAQIIMRIRALLDVDLPLVALFDAPTAAGIAAAVDAGSRVAPLAPIPRLRRKGAHRLSFAQHRLWFLNQLEPTSSEYHIPTALQLRGELDFDALRRALNEIVARHEVLRTTIITAADGVAVQHVHPPAPIDPPIVDLSGLPRRQAREEALQLVNGEAAEPFDLGAAPPMRVRLIRLANDDHALCVTFHHIASDEQSAAIFARELSLLYSAFHEGGASPLEPLPIQYADYAAWQRDWLSGEIRERQLAYWRTQLADLPMLRLPTDRPHPPVRRADGRVQQFVITAETADRLRDLNRRTGTSMFMVLLAGFQTLLARYCGQDDIAVGTPVSGRSHADTERLIGFFVNTLVLRADTSGDPTFREVVARVRRVVLDGLAHQDLPFEHLVEELQPQRDRARHPLFQVMFNYAVNDGADRPGLADVDACAFPVTYTATPFDLALSFSNTGRELRGSVEYSTALFDDPTIERLTGHLTLLLEGVAADPDRRVHEVSVVTDDERRWLHKSSRGPSAPPIPDVLIHELVDRHARTTPDKVAVADGTERLTYAELAALSNRIAHLLRDRGVGPESVVALVLERGVHVLAWALGALKAGGVYQPVDTATPSERLAYLLADSRPTVVVTTTHLRELLPARAQLPVVVALDEVSTRSALDNGPSSAPTIRLSPDCGAYLIYTSGSTGQPKGTIGTHRNLVYLHHAWTHTHGLPTNDTLLTTANLTFDAFTGDWTRALTTGATLHIGPDRRHLDPTHLAHLLTHHHITALETTPHQLTALHPHINPHHPPPLTTLIITADTWHAHDHHTTHTLLPHTQLLTSYGLTETTVDTTTCNTTHHQPHPQQTLPIGHPLPHTTVHLLDNHLQPVPPGIPGQIYITGTGLTRGYHNHPALTAERFIANPHTTNGTRLYRTGDQARRNPDGTLHFLGRTDHQINLHGHRIEPTEIETALTTHPHIHTAAITLHHPNNHPQLTAYIVTSTPPPTATQIRAYLKTRLPDHLIPAVFVTVNALPTTTTGKLDRQALPAPTADRPRLDAGFVEPATPAEQVLARIWRDVLGLDRVGVHDDFFDLGGDSILSLQIVARAREAGLRITPAQLFDNPTVAALSAIAGAEEVVDPEQERVSGPVGLLPIHRWWADQRLTDPDHFNQATWVQADVTLDPDALARAAAGVTDHHEALRLRADGYPDRLQLTIAAQDDPLVVRHRLPQDCDDREHRERLRAIAEAAQAGLNLVSGPVWRLDLVDGGPGRGSRVLIVVHHLAVDTVSWHILVEDLARAYIQVAAGQPVDLGPKTTPISQWAAYVAGVSHEDDTIAETPEPVERLPVDHDEGPTTYAQADTLSLRLDAETTRTLIKLSPSAYRTQINDLLLTALVHALHGWAGIRCASIELEGHGRTHTGPHDLSRTVGWFTTLTPVVLVHPESADDLASLIKSTKEKLRGASRRQLNGPSPRTGQTQIGFNYHGRLEASREEAVDGKDGRSLWRPVGAPTGSDQDPSAPLPHLLELTAAVAEDRLNLHLTYPVSRYRRETVDSLGDHLLRALTRIAAHTREVAENAPGAATPSDFPLAELSQDEVDHLVATAGFIVEDAYPLSPMQHGMLFHTLLAPSEGVYFEHTVLTYEGPMDPESLRAAFQYLVDRHPILRTAIRHHDQTTPLQLVAAQATIPFTVHDWTGLPDDRHSAKLAEFLAADRARGIDLSRPPLARLALIRHDPERHTLVMAEHHLLMDGWSLPILLDELRTVYEALANGRAPALRARRPYRDYIAWLAEQDSQEGLEFWRSQLAGFTASTPLATDPPRSDGGQATHHLELSADTTRRLTGLARTHQLTLNTVLRGALALLIAQHTGSTDVCYGATVADRPDTLLGAEHMLGLFINTLPVRVQVPAEQHLVDFLHDIQAQRTLQQPHQHTPLTSIRTVGGLAPNVPLFDTILVVHNYPHGASAGNSADSEGAGQMPRLCGMFGEPADHYPLSVMADPGPRLRLTLSFDRSRHTADTIERLGDHLVRWLEAMADDLLRTIGDVSLTSPVERDRLLEWSGEDVASAVPRPLLPELISGQARAHPNRAAIFADGHALTYAVLEENANRLSRYLRSLGAGPEAVVALVLPAGPELITALLGVWKSGAAYLPIEPDTPLARTGSYLTEASASLIITTTDLLDRLPDQPIPVVLLDDPATRDGIGACACTPLTNDLSTDNAAYLIFTSGSTGTPKAVTVTHGGLAAYIHNVGDRLNLRGAARYAIAQQLTVDFGNTLLYAALSSGGTVHLLPTPLTLHGPRLAGYLKHQDIDFFKITPSQLSALLAGVDDPVALLPRSALILGGEATPAELADTMEALAREAKIELHNHYGPTETSVGVTTHRVGEGRPGARLPIGTPLPGTTCHVLDRQLRPVPIGVPGELFLGGLQLARGYHGRAALTAERFVASPFSEDGARLYRTGDLVRWNGDGRLEFLRRVDAQVKVRGHRIEPGEIEAALTAHPQIVRAAVAAHRDERRGERLVGYLLPATLEQPPDAADVRGFLEARLPAHMVPGTFVTLDAIPLTPSGKIDRHALAAFEDRRPDSIADHAPPGTPTERALALIWSEVLGIDRIGVNDNFFDLGGHSLLATQVISGLHAELDVDLPVAAVFDAPTLAGLAAAADAARWVREGGGPTASDDYEEMEL